MPHYIHHTNGIILHSFNIGESHKVIEVLTEKLGFIRANVRSVRNERSKLRYGLENLSETTLSLVRGREVWRVTGALPRQNFYHSLKDDFEKLTLLLRIITLVRRLVQGEEKNKYLYLVIRELCIALSGGEHTEEELEGIECVAALRILHNLGYLKHESVFVRFFDDTMFSKEVAQDAYKKKEKAILEINNSLTASHL